MDGFVISPEMIKEYLASTQERIASLENSLLELETNPANDELVKSIFRDMHTIKGETGFMQLPLTEKLAHHAEDLLVKIRDKQLDVSSERISLLLKTVDAIKTIQIDIEASGNENAVNSDDYQGILNELAQSSQKESIGAEVKTGKEIHIQTSVNPQLTENEAGNQINTSGKQNTEEEIKAVKLAVFPLPKTGSSDQFTEEEINAAVSSLQKGFKLFHVNIALRPGQDSAEIGTKNIQEFFSSIGKIHASRPENGLPSQLLYSSNIAKSAIIDQCGFVLPIESIEFNPIPTPVSSNEKVESKPIAQSVKSEPAEKDEPKTIPSVKSEASIRISTELLDLLMNQVGELVLARNELMQLIREDDNTKYLGPAHSINIITSEIQEGIMKTRLQPIHTVWNRFPRVIRDVAIATGKDIELHMEGKDTELDKTLIEAIQDPLTHIVRNSVDHGVETPDIRIQNGKSPKGHVYLNAYHEGGQVNIVIRDDGAGIDVEKVIAKAVDKKLITQEEASRLSDREAFRLIFAPGLSTAKTITNISGRGVGMDVVRSNIEKIGGSIDITSTLGQGTAIQLRIPLTLAIIPALIIRSGGQLYAIPQVSLQELVRIDENSSMQIEELSGSKLFRLRGELLPLITLNEILGISNGKPVSSNKPTVEEKAENPTYRFQSESVNIVILNHGNKSFGLLVDGINDTEEIVVKPLSQNLKTLPVYSGATILGDGTVALILDVSGLAEYAKLASGQEHIVADSSYESQDGGTTEKMLLLSLQGNDHFAVPLSVVDRLEVFKRQDIERSSGNDVIQYRDAIIPLIYLEQALQIPASYQTEDELPCIVFSNASQTVGLVVGNIIDIVEERFEIQSAVNNNMLLGSAIIQSKSTDILDIYQIIKSRVQGWAENNSTQATVSESILVIETSKFVSNLLSHQLNTFGLKTEHCNQMQDAITRMKDYHYNAVLVDIDAKELNGLELIAKLKVDEQTKDIPIIALTNTLTNDVTQFAAEAGAVQCFLKLDKQSIIESILTVTGKK